MKQILLFLTIIIVVFLFISATVSGPFLPLNGSSSSTTTVKTKTAFNNVTQIKNGKTGIVSIALGLNDTKTTTGTVMKIVAFKGTASDGRLVVNFGDNFFTNENTYTIVASASGDTSVAYNVTYFNHTGNSATVYSQSLDAIVSGIAIGY